MKYLLQHWETLIETKIDPQILRELEMDEVALEYCLERSGQEKDKVCMELNKAATTLPSKKKTVSFIHNHQAGLIRLIDKMQEFIKDTPGQTARLYAGIQSHLWAVFGFLEEHFFRYFDFKERVPSIRMDIYRKEFSGGIQLLGSLLSKHKNIDTSMANAITCHFNWLLEGDAAPTYTEMGYGRELLQALLALFQNMGQRVDEDAVEQLLLGRNLNSKECMRAICQRIEGQLGRLPDDRSKKEHLLYLRKTILQVPIEHTTPANHWMPPLQGYLINWLDGELGYLEGTHKLVGQAPRVANPYQMRFDTSVKVLAIIGRAFFDTKIILNDNRRETLENLASHIATIGSDAVSYKALIKKGSNPEPRDKEIAKELLMKLFNQIRKY